MLNEYEVGQSNIVYAGYLERKGTSLIMPWKQRWIVLTTDGLKIYREEDTNTFKADLPFDEKTCIAIAEPYKSGILQTAFVPSQEVFKFCVLTGSGMEEFNTYSGEDRNNWVRHLSEVAQLKNPGAGFVIKVDKEAQFQYLQRWEQNLTTHNIDKATDIMAFDTVEVDIYDPTTGQTHIQKRLASASGDDVNFIGFLPFAEWLREFEPDTYAAREQALKERKMPTPKGAGERMRDYVADKIVERYTENATPKACNMLLEGLCEMISRSERQLVRRYHLCAAAAEGKGIVPNVPQAAAATTVSELQHSRILVKGEEGSVPEMETAVDIPLDIQKDVIGMLSALRALISTYRFEEVNDRDEELRFLRKLSIHRLVTGTQCALLKLQREAEGAVQAAMEQAQQAIDEVGQKVEETTQRAAQEARERGEPASLVERMEQQTGRLLEMQRGGAMKEVTAGILNKEAELEEGGGEGEEGAQQKDQGEGQQVREWAQALQKEAKGEEREPYQYEGRGQAGQFERKVPGPEQKQQAQGEGEWSEWSQGKGEGGEGQQEQESLPIEQRRELRQKGAQLREQTLERLRSILRPQLTRIKDEMAPLVQSFKDRTKINVEEIEGIAADVTNTVGDAVVQFVERRVDMLEHAVTQQLEVLQELVADLREQSQEQGGELDAGEVIDRVVRKTGEAQGVSPDEASAAAQQYIAKVQQLRAAIQQQVREFRQRAEASWYGTDRDALETIILERCDELYNRMKDLVGKGTSYAMLAMLYLFATGMGSEKAPVVETPQGDFPSTMPQPAVPQYMPHQQQSAFTSTTREFF